MKAISVSTFAIAAVAMMTVVPVTALPTAISLATNASPTLPVVDGTMSFGPPASQTDLRTPTPTGVVRLNIHGDPYVDHSRDRAKKQNLPIEHSSPQKEAEPKVESKTRAQKKNEEANAIFEMNTPNDWARVNNVASKERSHHSACSPPLEIMKMIYVNLKVTWAPRCLKEELIGQESFHDDTSLHLYSQLHCTQLNSTSFILMPDDAGGDCVSIFCGCCCVGLMSALSSWCNTIAPYSCCSCCRSNSVPSTFDEQVRQDMEKSKAEDAAKKQKQMEPTPNMNVSKPPASTE
ncbi:uncharacterized protein C8R40DRAFT_1074036 [Lentinula edodes]|nr:uncharacterized protein C8R40DRAFT_1074036 [Lentinula edodes]KAH7869519.1 hypothetical protein C8R40DRAFT_1074036 [Lentinula edodes]